MGSVRTAGCHGSRRRWIVVAGWLALLSLVRLGIAGGAAARVVAVGDVHGSIDGLTAILEEAGLIDGNGHWVGGTTVLVQTGDLLDRGAHVREVMDLLMRLQREAPAAGGEVHCLLGNHEVMNLLGLVRDANPDAYRDFVGANSERRRNRGLEEAAKCAAERAGLLGREDAGFGEEERQQWLDAHPPGRLEYADALGPGGMYGRWLRSLPTVVRVDDTVFVHGGISPALEGQSPAAINARVSSEIRRFGAVRKLLAAEGLLPISASVVDVVGLARELGKAALEVNDENGSGVRRLAAEVDDMANIGGWYLVHPDGPLWFRGLASWAEDDHAADVAAVLDALDAERMVIGHTPSANGTIVGRFGGRVLAIDTGMLSEVYEHGRPSALEIAGVVVTAIYVGERDLLVDGTWRRITPVAAREAVGGG